MTSLASANGVRKRYTVDLMFDGEQIPIFQCGTVEEQRKTIDGQIWARDYLGLKAGEYRIRNTATGEVVE